MCVCVCVFLSARGPNVRLAAQYSGGSLDTYITLAHSLLQSTHTNARATQSSMLVNVPNSPETDQIVAQVKSRWTMRNDYRFLLMNVAWRAMILWQSSPMSKAEASNHGQLVEDLDENLRGEAEG